MGIIKLFTMVKQAKGNKQMKPTHRFVINCNDPCEDNVLILGDFASYMESHIKVDNKINNLGQSVSVSQTGKYELVVEAKIAFSKRYLKYLTKKYLAKQDLRQYLRVTATNKNTYDLKFLAVNNDQED